MGRRPCCAKVGLNRGAWSAREDNILTNYIKTHGEGKWRDLPQRAGLKRCGKSCRLRWLNYLRPDIKRGNISDEEEELIIKLHKLLGNRWSLIAGRLPGRTDNEIKNYWNTTLSKRVQGDNNIIKSSDQGPKRRLEKPEDTLHLRKSSVAAVEPIRTKAVRCTKVIIPQLMENHRMVENNLLVPDHQWDNASDESSSPAVQADNSMDYLLDFDISDFMLDALNKDLEINNDYSETVEEEGKDAGGLKKKTFYQDLPELDDINLEDELKTENFRVSDDAFRENEVLNLKNLSLFLNSEDDQLIN